MSFLKDKNKSRINFPNRSRNSFIAISEIETLIVWWLVNISTSLPQMACMLVQMIRPILRL